MSLLRRRKSDNSEAPAATLGAGGADDRAPSSKAAGFQARATEGKGRPTPRRRDSERRRGPVAKAPMTRGEARERRKATKGPKLSRDAKKQAAAARRTAAAERRAGMMAGEDKYLLPRDRGPVRAYARDLIDARRNLIGLFMPMALLLIFAMFLKPAVQSMVTIAMLVLVLFMVGEGFYLGRMVNRRVLERFPDSTETGFKLGWYVFLRASQLRKIRAPRPRLKPGDAV